MAVILKGVGASIDTDVLEEALVALIRYGQVQERNATTNPQNINNITSSENEDTATLIATVTFSCTASLTPEGYLLVVAPDYLSGVTFSPGVGGDIKNPTWVGALIEATILQKNLELNSLKNPSLANNISYTITNGTTGATTNATFSANYSLPVNYELQSNGAKTSNGAAYLL